MSVEALEPAPCINHRQRITGLRCGKCGNPLCTACMVQTPVGVRCRSCAQVKRLPQFDVGPWLLARSGLAGLATSTAVWFVVASIAFLAFFLAILVGIAVAEVMSRLARRRVSRLLEVTAVVDVVVGLLIVASLRPGGLHVVLTNLAMQPRAVLGLIVPAAVASFVAVIKLR